MRLKLTWIAPFALLVALVLVGCSARTNGAPDDTDKLATAETGGPLFKSAAEKPANADKADKADMAALARGSNQLTFDLFRALPEKGNVFASPFGVATALSLTFANNDGDALARAMHLSCSQERLNYAYAGLLWKIQGEGKARPYQLDVANAVWLTTSKEFKPSQEYVKKARDNYAAPPHSVDFLGDGVQQINKWCGDNTHDKIKKILEPGDVNKVTAAVLTNAIYFKGDWKYKFKKEQTNEAGEFQAAPDRKVKAPLMSQLLEANYGKADGVQVVELPYKGDELSMIVVLPEKADGLAEVERKLSAKTLDEWAEKMQKRKVRVTLPRFKVEGQPMELKDQLETLGLPMKASPDVGTPPPGMFLYIDKVIHRGYVEVNEEGSEAAAVTAVVVNWKDKGGREDEPETFRADHPFVFLIRDNATGCVLFIGRFVEPK